MSQPTVVRPRKSPAPKGARRTTPPKEVNPRSGRALRQLIPTGTVAEVEAAIRRVGLPLGHAQGP